MVISAYFTFLIMCVRLFHDGPLNIKSSKINKQMKKIKVTTFLKNIILKEYCSQFENNSLVRYILWESRDVTKVFNEEHKLL